MIQDSEFYTNPTTPAPQCICKVQGVIIAGSVILALVVTIPVAVAVVLYCRKRCAILKSVKSVCSGINIS